VSLEVGGRAPDFTVDTTEGTRSLEALLTGGPLVLVFYSEDATPACTTQLCTFRDDYDTLRDLGATVLAVSADDIESHRSFEERVGGLPFPLAADANLEIARTFGVIDADDARRARRAVFVIGRNGAILEAIPHYQPTVPEHFAAVFRALGLPI
jgi:peroxiredoxin Q/BCP